MLHKRGLPLDLGFPKIVLNDGIMLIFFRITTILALLVALVWCYSDFKFDSAFAATIALAAVIALFIKREKKPNQSQRVRDGSTGIQAAGDVNIGSIQTNKEVKDAE